jgi:hypothetical protein
MESFTAIIHEKFISLFLYQLKIFFNTKQAKMWYAVTAHAVKRSKKQQRKEFSSFSGEVVMSSPTLSQLQDKIQESISRYPDQTNRYLRAGIKLVEARSSREAKQKSQDITFYFTDTGQYGFF